MGRLRFPLLLFLALPAAAAGQARAWSPQLGGSVFGLVTTQSTLRGADGLAGAGWLHASVSGGNPASRLSFGAMVSLEPLFLGKCGYPRILSGASVCETDPFVDRSHTHPFIMQLVGSYERQIGSARLGLSAGLAGDPALGPEVYLHRPSASLDPIAPLLMHELNPAHAVHGVVTGMLQLDRLRFEGSVFNGGGTDHDPYDFDLAPLHSWSARARWQVTPAAALQLSHGDLQASSAHAAHGGGTIRVQADIASLEAQRMIGGFMVAATAGASRHKGEADPAYAGLLELQATRGRHTLFARGEWAKRAEVEGIHIIETDEHFFVTHDFRVAELAAGYGLRLLQAGGLELSAGARGSLSFIPEYLQPRYGHARATTMTVFLHAGRASKAAAHHHP